MENRYFIVVTNYGFVGDVYNGFTRESQETVDNYCRKHSNSKILLATPYQRKYIEMVEELKSKGITVY